LFLKINPAERHPLATVRFVGHCLRKETAQGRKRRERLPDIYCRYAKKLRGTFSARECCVSLCFGHSLSCRIFSIIPVVALL